MKRRPVRKNNRLRVITFRFQCERIAGYDIFPKYEPDSVAYRFLAPSFVKREIYGIKYVKQSPPTRLDIIRKKIDAVYTPNRYNGVPLEFELASSVISFYTRHFSFKNRNEKISSPACGLEKPRFDALGLVPNQINHGIYLPLSGKYFAMISHSLF